MKLRSALPLVLGIGFFGPALSLLDGCGSASSGDNASNVGTTRAALRRMQSCEELTQALRDDALSKMNQRIDAEIRATREGYPMYGWGITTGNAAPGGAVAMPSAAVAESAKDADSTAAPAHSETETQVKGVDEADIVKADGTKLYVLHGQKFLIVDAWPAKSLALEKAVDIEGDPSEMFVANGKAVVFSTADGAPLYSATGRTPRTNYSDQYARPLYAGVADGGYSYGAVSYSYPVTKVTVLTLDGGNVSIERELYFEGNYLSSRRVDNSVRLVLEGGGHGPSLDYAPVYTSKTQGSSSSETTYQDPSVDDKVAAWEKLRTKNVAAINATLYEDWIPTGFTKGADGVRVLSAGCSDFYVPTMGSTEFGMTQIQTFDLAAASQPPRSVTIMGAAETVYGNAGAMVLAGRAYTDPWVWREYYALQNGSTATGDAPASQTLNYTYLHLFDLASDAGSPRYVASGKVPGDVKDQFALDEKAGSVRVATTEQRTGAREDGRQDEVSHVYVLENRQQTLTIVGDAGEIAPGEQLYSTRYIGDKAYVVTWHVTDPLFVIDLADPTRPTVLGQLEIPGFSEYMHPLDDTHLLTIGRETDDTGHQHTTGGYWYGLSIQVFDVTDPLKPNLMHKYVYDGGEYATSEATQNHKAFTYFDDRKWLAFPYVRQTGWGASGSEGPSSTLEIFHVDVPTGIAKIGSVDHSSVLAYSNGSYGYCGGYYDGAIRRGVFFENVVYSISYGGILANDVSDLATAIATLKLDAPNVQGMYCAE